MALTRYSMCLNYAVFGLSLSLASCEIPHWQRQIPYNDIAHLFHSMYREMFIPFDATNRTAGSIIMHKMEKLVEGAKELKKLTEVTPEQEFHKKYLEPVRFMILRGRQQWKLIGYSDGELREKYGWEEEDVMKFRDMYREILDLVNEMEEDCNRRHVDLSDT